MIFIEIEEGLMRFMLNNEDSINLAFNNFVHDVPIYLALKFT